MDVRVRTLGKLSAELQPCCHADCEEAAAGEEKGNTKITSALMKRGESGQRQK